MMRRVAISFLEILIILGVAGAIASAQSPLTSKPMAAESRNRNNGFLDYALGKINPGDRDYGTLMQAERAAVVQHTIDDLYFWSNVVSLVLLTGAIGLIFLQWRAADKQELIAASLIAEFWNGRVSDRIEIERRTEQFNQLVAAHNAQVESSLSAKPHPASASELKRTVEALDKRNSQSTLPFTEEARVASETAVEDALSPQGPVSGLQQRNVMLERQVEAMKNTETNLRRRLNDTMARLEQERNRNQALKGA